MFHRAWHWDGISRGRPRPLALRAFTNEPAAGCAALTNHSAFCVIPNNDRVTAFFRALGVDTSSPLCLARFGVFFRRSPHNRTLLKHRLNREHKQYALAIALKGLGKT